MPLVLDALDITILVHELAFFGCLAATGLLVFVIVMGIRKPAVAAMVTLPVVVILCPLAGMFTGRTEWPPEETPRLWAVFGFCFGATIAIAVLALRIAGYRLWRGPLGGNLSASVWAVCATKVKFEGIGGLILALCPVRSFSP